MTTDSYLIAIAGIVGAVFGGIATKLGETLVDEIKKRWEDRSTIRFADIDDISRWKWTGEKLLKKLIELDFETMEADPNGVPIDLHHEGTPEQWDPVFMSNPLTWSLLVSGKNEILGYWHFVALNDTAFQQAKSGQLYDSEITIDSIVPIDAEGFGIPGIYNLYFAFIGTKDSFIDYRRWRLELFKDFHQKLAALADQGVFFQELCANAVTKNSEAVCAANGLTRGAPHVSGRGHVYTTTLIPWPEKIKHSRFNDIREKYEEAGRQ